MVYCCVTWPGRLAVRTPPSQGGGHEFESRPGYQFTQVSGFAPGLFYLLDPLRDSFGTSHLWQ